MQKLWHDWMRNKSLTVTGSLKRPSISLIIGWVKEVWERITEQMVRKSIVKCGISNKMDGMEDDALYEDFLAKGVAETEDVVDNDGYADIC